LLSDSGITLAAVYTAKGEVLMGTLRWEKEQSERMALELVTISEKLERVKLHSQESELLVRVKSLQTELTAKQLQRSLLSRTISTRKQQQSRDRMRRRELRGEDALPHPQVIGS
jgi:circadian clock protein KaiC